MSTAISVAGEIRRADPSAFYVLASPAWEEVTGMTPGAARLRRHRGKSLPKLATAGPGGKLGAFGRDISEWLEAEPWWRPLSGAQSLRDQRIELPARSTPA